MTMMKDTHRQIAAMCRTPQPLEVITAAVGCTKVCLYNLVARGLLRNVGTRKRALLQVVEGVSVEPERTFRTPEHIVQASSVWHYARRVAGAVGREAA